MEAIWLLLGSGLAGYGPQSFAYYRSAIVAVAAVRHWPFHPEGTRTFDSAASVSLHPRR